MTAPIRVLIVEDDTVDRLACRRELTKSHLAEFVVLEATTGREGLQLAALHKPDCILLDYHLPDMNGIDFLSEMAGADQISTPIMLLTGAESAAVVAAAIKRGARDYLGKDIDGQYLKLLPTAIQRMLREQKLAEGKRQAEAKFRSLVEQIEAITYIVPLDGEGITSYISPQISKLGYSPEQWLADPELHARQIHPDDREMAMRSIENSRKGGHSLRQEYRLMMRNGETLWVRDEAKAVSDETGRYVFLQGILLDITQSKLAEHALRKSQEELRQLAGHLERIKEEERKRIAQEIHDELGGLLAGIKAYVSVYIEREARSGRPPEPLLVDAVALADTGFQAVRRVITDLRPSVLDQLGVWAALEWYASQIEKRSKLQCTCIIEDDAAAIEPDSETSTMLFRVVQEALTNVVRHAEATTVSIHVALDDAMLVISVQDNGNGIDSARQLTRESWGITGMGERARYFGGEVTITGKIGEGTCVKLHLPLEKLNSE
ncbi:response regulator [Solimicrobium silvestre]|uniref:PAS domain S-box protein n=1 Tax=Solimicrobium silvestre TaxID=2099400 RepID=A0A2S9H0F4_9BURK|nr:response regulator [Solimicrobium silvestre]PRC93465.1 PAS domain S-box protein [Solimicrobium silvestre]